MVSKVADILLVAEGNAEAHRIIRFPFLASSCNRTPCKVIPTGTDARLRRSSGTTPRHQRMRTQDRWCEYSSEVFKDRLAKRVV